VGDRDAGGSEFVDDGNIEVDVGTGGEEVGECGFVGEEFTQRAQRKSTEDSEKKDWAT